MKTIKGHLIDIHQRRIIKACVEIENQRIKSIKEVDKVPDQYLLPGFVDSHIHIESSMLVPYEFARIALTHGTVATISDPHEIANVVGVAGVEYMLENATDAKLKFHFGAPSCVPATSFESAGAVIDSDAVKALLERDDIYYLSEMMNYPGVLFKDEEVMKKIQAAHDIGKPVDGHAPGLMGKEAESYIAAGISTDHECFTLEEALNKLNHGMKILIREGSAAKNYNALHSLIKSHPSEIMFCSDDKHPDDLLEGHINQLVLRSLAQGYELFDVLNIACKHPVEHYKMDVGLLRVGDFADFIVVNNPQELKVQSTFINGEEVAKESQSILMNKTHAPINNFNIGEIETGDIKLKAEGYSAPVIEVLDGELITEKKDHKYKVTDGYLESDPMTDILKVVVVNRYNTAPPAIGFIHNFNIKNGAIASTVAHDSHNIICVGSSDEHITNAINLIIESKGGLSAISETESMHIALPVAGLMSDLPCEQVGIEYADIDAFAKKLGCTLRAPFMSLSFMALLVIPKIKMSDKGIFDAEAFKFY